MKLVCAWCGTTIERTGYDAALDRSVSHGMCPACSEAWRAQEHGLSLQNHIDSIAVPILLVDSYNTILAVNRKASEILGVPPESIRETQFGSVFDCVHSNVAEGCGRSIHCSGCAIRRSVAETYQTGKPQIAVPATLSVASPEKPSEVVFTLTTARNGQVVLIRIDRMQHASREPLDES